MKVLSTEFDLTANRAVLFEQYRDYFLVLLLSVMMDGLSTIYFMGRLGPDVEFNAVVRELSFLCGIIAGPLIGKTLQVIAVWFITMFAPYLTRSLCSIIVCANCYAFVVNMNV